MTARIALQLYTLRDFTKTPADIAQTLSRVRKVGYDAVQLSALGAIDPQELDRILRGEGLTVAATHVSLDRLENETAAVIDEHRLWGCRYIAVGGFFQKQYASADWFAFAQRYNRIAQKFSSSGISLGYHNHSHELARFDGVTALQILLDQLDPAVWFELDTYWLAHGGADPVQWIDRCAGRTPCIHLKDMGINPDRTQLMAEVGEGNLNWTAILSACRRASVEWLIIEQDTCYRDPFESVAISLRNLKAFGPAAQ